MYFFIYTENIFRGVITIRFPKIDPNNNFKKMGYNCKFTNEIATTSPESEYNWVDKWLSGQMHITATIVNISFRGMHVTTVGPGGELSGWLHVYQ